MKPTVRTGLTRDLIHLGAPIVLSNLAYTLLGAVDTLFMGRVSTVALGAVGLANLSFFTASVVLRGTIGGAMPFVARMYGANRPEAAGRYLKYFLAMALLLTPLTALLPWIYRVLYGLVRPDADVLTQTLTYLDIRIWELPFSLLSAALMGFLIGVGNSRLPMVLAWSAVSLNIVISYILIFGKLGFPAMGVAGVALGTVIAVVIQTLAALYLVYRLYGKQYHLRRMEWPRWRDLVEMSRVGLPMGLAEGMEVGAFTGFFAILSRLGSAELAASQVANQIGALAFMPGFALSSATGSLVGRWLGAGKPDVARAAGYRGVALGAGVMGMVGIVFLLVPWILVRPFTPDLEVLRLGAVLLRLMALYQLFDAMNIIFRGALNGAGDTRYTLLMTGLFAWGFFIPGAYLAIRWGWGLVGAWAAALIYIVLVGITFMLRFRGGRWQRVQIAQTT